MAPPPPPRPSFDKTEREEASRKVKEAAKKLKDMDVDLKDDLSKTIGKLDRIGRR